MGGTVKRKATSSLLIPEDGKRDKRNERQSHETTAMRLGKLFLLLLVVMVVILEEVVIMLVVIVLVVGVVMSGADGGDGSNRGNGDDIDGSGDGWVL